MTYQPALPESEGYELFRQAIVERSDEAWRQIYVHYRPILLAWSRQYCSHVSSAEPAEDVADRALARTWAALSPEHFRRFNCLAALLAYLRACVSATVIDQVRLGATSARALQRLEAENVATPEQIVVRASAKAALWELVKGVVESEQEWIILEESFALARAPRQIFERHPQQFASVAAVYATKRNLLSRLMRCRELRQLHEEWQL